MRTANTGDLPLVRGAIVGLGAWLFGYVLTYVVVAPSVRDSSINRLLEAFEGSLPTFDIVGWTFFNAHFVDTLVQGALMGESATSFIGGDNGFSVILYLIPPALLLAAGLVLARQQQARSPTRGAVVGVTVLPAYLLLSIAGALVFEVSMLGATLAPDLVMAMLLAGVVYPLLFAGAGGAIGGYLEQRETSAGTLSKR